jgi:hypothetical protein
VEAELVRWMPLILQGVSGAIMIGIVWQRQAQNRSDIRDLKAEKADKDDLAGVREHVRDLKRSKLDTAVHVETVRRLDNDIQHVRHHGKNLDQRISQKGL